MTKSLGRAAPAMVALLWAACSTSASTSSGGSDAGASADVDASNDSDTAKPAQCKPAVNWKPGTPAFSEATEAWGLTGIQGGRIRAIDFDGDGWTDLLVHGGGKNEFKPGDRKSTRLNSSHT